jgi:protein O-mannosyl-transferase
MSSSPSTARAGLIEPQTAPSIHLFGSEKRRTLLACLLLAAAVLLAYLPVAHNSFINYDDPTYITDNPHVKAGLTWQTVKWAFTADDAANYHPLTWLSHALDYQLFGANAAAHHEISVLLQAANAVLLFLFLQNATGFQWRSLFVAALFALHPLNVESVAWAAERKNVLSMLFFLLALSAYGRYARQPRALRYAVVAILFALGLLSKPQVITFPVLLLLWDWWPLRRFLLSPAHSAMDHKSQSELGVSTPRAGIAQFSASRLVLEKFPLLALSAASTIITMKAQKAGGAIQTLTLYSPLLRLETAVVSSLRYLAKILWPTNLVALYPHPTRLYPAAQFLAAALVLVLITVAVIRARHRRYLAVGWLWFLIALIPMIGLVQVGAQSMADRYAYIPQIGIFLMLTWLISDLAETRRLAGRKLAVPAIACLLILGALTYRQIRYWHDIPSFWLRTLALTEDNYFAHDTLGAYLASQGQTEQAAVHFRAALAIRPDDLPANLNLGTYEHAHGNLPKAIARYQVVAARAADVGLRATAFGNMGSAYRQLGDFVRARQCFDTALKLAPDNIMSMIGLGLIAQRTGDPAEAVRQYSRAMNMQPTDVGYLLLAGALQQEGNTAGANAMTERAAHLSPDLVEAQAVAQSLLAGK